MYIYEWVLKVEKRQLWVRPFEWMVETQLCKLRGTSDRNVRWTCLFYISFIIWFLWTKPTIWLLTLSFTKNPVYDETFFSSSTASSKNKAVDYAIWFRALNFIFRSKKKMGLLKADFDQIPVSIARYYIWRFSPYRIFCFFVGNATQVKTRAGAYMYMYNNCDFFVCFRTYLFVRALLAKILNPRRYRKPVRNLWSRFELDPSTVARVAGAQSFFFPGVDKTISRGFGEIMTQRQQQQ